MKIYKLTSDYILAVKNNDRERESILKSIISKFEGLKNLADNETVNKAIKQKYEDIKNQLKNCPSTEKNILEDRLAIIKEYLPVKMTFEECKEYLFEKESGKIKKSYKNIVRID